MNLEAAVNLIFDEYKKASMKHPDMRSIHEGKAIIEEELDELWDEIKKQKPDLGGLIKEASQVGAMALRFLIDLVPFEPNKSYDTKINQVVLKLKRLEGNDQLQ